MARDYLEHQKQGLKKFVVEKGLIIPTNDSYGEKKNLVQAEKRCQMIRMAIDDVGVGSWIQCDDWETKQNGWVTTITTLRHQQKSIDQEYRNNCDRPVLKLLVGADLIESIKKPGLWDPNDVQEIFGIFGAIVISRHGTSIREFIAEHPILMNCSDNIEIVKEWILNDISATKLRDAIRKGLSIKYLTPDSVIEYIGQEKLYRD